MLAGGQVDRDVGYVGRDEITDVLELIQTNSTPSFGKLPSVREGPVGAMIGNAPTLCGGVDNYFFFLDSCISFENSQWSLSYTMTTKRANSAGVKINSTTFWILGGTHYTGIGWFYIDSTEFITQGQTNGVLGPKLPYGLEKMCAVKLSEEEIFVIGGRGSGDIGITNEVWIYNPQKGFARRQGPSLKYKRFAHSCGIMRDDEKTYIVVAGGLYLGDVYLETLDSVEIYDTTDNTWHSGINIFPHILSDI